MKGIKDNQHRKPMVSDEYWHATETRDALRAGYLETARLAEQQMEDAERRGDRAEAGEYAKLLRYSLRKANSPYPDADLGDNHSLYEYNERIGTRDQLDSEISLPDDEDAIPKYEQSDVWSREGRYAIAGALALLTPMQRRIFKLYHVQGVNRKTAADLMDMHLATFDVHVRDINKRLRTYVTNLDAIAQECDVEAEALLIRLRGEQRIETERLRKKNEELKAQQKLRNRQLFYAACEAGVLCDDEMMAYRRASIDNARLPVVAEEMGLDEDALKKIIRSAVSKVTSMSKTVEIKVVPKMA